MRIYYYQLDKLITIDLPKHCFQLIHLKNKILNNNNDYNFHNLKITYIDRYNNTIEPDNYDLLNEDIDYILSIVPINK
jgi:hypothetical protein